MTDILLNLLIFLITTALMLNVARKDGQWKPEQWKKAFRYFTVQSNVFCAAGCLLTAIFAIAGEVPEWVWLMKYTGTAAVTVTMLTVFLFLAPSTGNLKGLLSGSSLFLHLITPLLAIISFSFFEKRGMSFSAALLGMLPVILYGALYLRKVVYSPEEERWDDFYGFNKGGKWPIAFAAMLAGTFVVCIILMCLQNM